jgi:hypothetical protein
VDGRGRGAVLPGRLGKPAIDVSVMCIAKDRVVFVLAVDVWCCFCLFHSFFVHSTVHSIGFSEKPRRFF